ECLPKGRQIRKTPAITLDAIRQLIADLTTALEAQTVAIASASIPTSYWNSYSKNGKTT
ncbi:hypothetical protein Tco_0673850, partial [Tanacetum coccineum]